MKKRNPLKGLAAHEGRVSSKPVKAKVTLKKHEEKEKSDEEKKHHKKDDSLRTPKGRVSKERNALGEFSMAHLKREMKKRLGY